MRWLSAQIARPQIGLAIFAALSLSSAYAEQNLTNALSNETEVRLLIGVITNNIVIGAPATIHASVKNESTNTVIIFHSGRLPHDFGVFITGESGSKVDLTPKIPRQPINVDFGSLNLEIPPGTARESDVRITFDKQLAPGNYSLELTREVHTPGVQRTIVSNPLQIRLVKNE